MPVAHTLVVSPCSWRVQTNVIHNRIPSQYLSTLVLTITRLLASFPDTITEVVCQNPGRDCAGSQFKCRQMRTKMEVVYVELNQSSGPGVLNTAIVREDSGK